MSSLYPELTAFKKALSADISRVVQMGCMKGIHIKRQVADSQGPHNLGNTILLIVEVSSSSQKWYGWHAAFSVFMSVSGNGNVEWVSGKQDKASATMFSSPLMYTIFALNCDINSIQCA